MKKKDDLIISDSAAFVFSNTNNVLFDMSDSVSFRMKSVWNENKPEPEPTQAKDLSRVTGEIAKWGDNNLRPQEIKALIASSFVLKSGFKKRYTQAFSNGIITKIWKEGPDGSDILVRKRVPQFEEFWRRNGYGHTYIMQAIKDILRFQIAFPEFVKSADHSKILVLKAQKAVESRFSIQNADGSIDKCYISADWAQTRDVTDRTKVKELSVIQDTYFAPEKFKNSPDFNAIYPIHQAMDEGYYPDQDWLSKDMYDLVDISTSWAKFVKHLMQNASIINYVVNIKDWYWPARFGSENWSKFTPEEKVAKRKAEIKAINDNVTGIEKVGKMLLVDVKTKFNEAFSKVSTSKLDEFSKAWEIEVLPQPKTDQTFLESFNSANRSIQHAIQLDSSTYGSLSGEGDKGGSDKQQSYNISLIADEYIRQLIVKPLNFIRDYNGWSTEIEFDFDLPVMQTMAAIPPKDRNIQPQK